MFFKIIKRSQNRKTGKCVVVRASTHTCPVLCPLQNGACYCKNAPYIRYRWFNMGAITALTWQEFLIELNKLQANTLVRYGDAGDLPGDGWFINKKLLTELDQVADKAQLRMWTYTHYLSGNRLHGPYETNYSTLINRECKSFTINISTENIDDAASMFKRGLPTTLAVPSDWTTKNIKHQETKFVLCPAIYGKTQCITCGGKKGPLCFQQDRDFIIMFPAHGSGKKKVNQVIQGFKDDPLFDPTGYFTRLGL